MFQWGYPFFLNFLLKKYFFSIHQQPDKTFRYDMIPRYNRYTGSYRKLQTQRCKIG